MQSISLTLESWDGRMPGASPASSVVQRIGSGAACLEEARSFDLWVCPKDGTEVRRFKPCKEARLCEFCSKIVAAREGRRAEYRLREVGRIHYERYEPRHIVVSFDAQIGPTTRAEYDHGYKAAWSVLRKMGSRGGLVIYHPERHHLVDGSVCWAKGPHYHAVAFGFVDEWMRPLGVVVRTIGEQDSLRATVAYLYNHAGFIVRKHVVRWYGIASYAKAKGIREPAEEAEEPQCPLCGSVMVQSSVGDWTGGTYDEIQWRRG